MLTFRTHLNVLVPDYEVIQPKKVDKEGKFLSHQLSHKDDSREGEDLHYNIKAFGENFNLHLKKNDKLFAKNLEVEVLGHHGKLLRKEKINNCHYHGHSTNHFKSKATLSTCDNLVSTSDASRRKTENMSVPNQATKRNKAGKHLF